MHPLRIYPSRHFSVMIPNTKQCGKYLYSTYAVIGFVLSGDDFPSAGRSAQPCANAIRPVRKNSRTHTALVFRSWSSPRVAWRIVHRRSGKRQGDALQRFPVRSWPHILKCAGSLESREELHCGPDPKAPANGAPFLDSQSLIGLLTGLHAGCKCFFPNRASRQSEQDGGRSCLGS